MQGALLNAIKAELLLEYDDFCRVINYRAEKAATPLEEDAVEGWLAIENDFNTLSQRAWNTVATQVFKIFVLNRVTPRSFRALPLAGAAKYNDASLAAGNFYGGPETALLQWMTLNVAVALPQLEMRVTNFDSDLRSGVVLFSAMANHWPALAPLRGELHYRPDIDMQYKENAALVVRCARASLSARA